MEADQTAETPTPNQEPVTPEAAEPTIATTAGDQVTEQAPANPLADPVTPVAAEPVTPAPESTTPPEPEAAEPAPEVGVVPKPSEYVLPEGVPDNVRIFAHENGLTQDQLNASLNQFGGYMQGMKGAEQEALRTMGEAHLKNWGAESDTKLNLARQALKQNDPDGALGKALEESGYGNHPAVLDFLHTIGKNMQEGGYLKSSVPRPPGQKTLAEAMYGDSITKKE